MQYKYWFQLFTINKVLVETFDLCHVNSVHSIKRYIDADNRHWESAITFTNKIVIRSGLKTEDGVIKWGPWETLHEIEFE